MRLSDHDLSQLDDEDLLNLPEEVLRRLSIKLLNDLKEARERLKQNSRNSSRPPSSEAPWEKKTGAKETPDTPEAERGAEPQDNQESSFSQDSGPASRQAGQALSDGSRKPGKQPGAEGFGRQQRLAITAHEHHFPALCNCCRRPLNADAKTAYTAFETVDIEWAAGDAVGLRLSNTRHSYYEILCACGHVTRQEPYRSVPHESLPSIVCGQWRLVGPGLAALIICLAYRMRLSRERIREFLQDWLGLQLSIGTINNTLHESGAAAMSLEEELTEAVLESQLLHVDETSWMESGALLWLWVFSAATVTAYWIGYRTAELIDNLLGQVYGGWLMSDGYQVYRKYPNRVRCWAHLLRKAQGLEESLHKEAQGFGKQTRGLLETLMAAIREARSSPPGTPLTETHQAQLAAYRRLCEHMKTAPHDQAKALATEMLNDWDAIFRVLHHPHLPLTNNEAERALRHWVILRRISHGTRTEEGSRSFALLISIIETCRKRQQSPWIYLAAVIHHQRAGLAAPKLPIVKGV